MSKLSSVIKTIIENILSTGTTILEKGKRNPLAIICLLSIFNIVLCASIFLFQIKSLSKTASPSIGEKEETLSVASDYVLYDLPLPDWARGFMMPISGTKVPENEHHLPNAERNYRNGRHEGLDIMCNYGTLVMAAKDGHVLTIQDGQNIPPPFRNQLLKISKNLFETPPEILRVMHGRHIIIDHGVINGRWIVTVYSHLSEVVGNIKVGDFVSQGQIIGFVGNSGTSSEGTEQQPHLHFEIRVNGHYLGETMTSKEAGRLYRVVLNGGSHKLIGAEEHVR
jgi:murein DD-endopeptidase MepM/ murein hydrolase activator NlpD